MAGFLYAMLAVLLASLGARDQMLVADLAARLGARVSLLAVATVTATMATAAAAWGASELAQIMPGKSRLIVAALALALGGGEALILRPRPAPREPTRSLVAVGIVLLAQQITDSARFLVFALGLATMAPVPALIGGVTGSMAALTLGWTAGPALAPLARRARPMAGAVLLVAAAWTAWSALG